MMWIIISPWIVLAHRRALLVVSCRAIFFAVMMLELRATSSASASASTTPSASTATYGLSDDLNTIGVRTPGFLRMGLLSVDKSERA